VLDQANSEAHHTHTDPSLPPNHLTYKDDQGEWIKWVVERCTPDQLAVYNQARERLDRSYSDNEILIFLNSGK
jgi:hypothetical protein